MHRYNLSNAMHMRIMGDQFLNYRRNSRSASSATVEALQRRGLLDEHYHRTPAAMAYIQEKCNGRNERLQERYPDTPVVASDTALLCLTQDHHDVSVYIYAGSTPLVVSDGDGQSPIGLLCTRYLWDIQVGMTNGVKNAGHFLKYSSVSGHKGSYGYDIDEDKANEMLEHLHHE